MRGKVAACTREAWSTDIAKRKPAGIEPCAPDARNVDDELDAALGIRTKVGAP